MKLSDILSADFVRSKEGLSADRLRASVGAAHRDAFDFDAMSLLLADTSANVPLPERRRRRVRGLLSTLRAQRFFVPASDSDKGIDVGEPYSFVFESCTDAVAAYRERLPKMIELAGDGQLKLETEGEYSEARHDAFFRSSAPPVLIRKTSRCSGLSDLSARGRSGCGGQRSAAAGLRRWHAN
jgi:hypothetical protein